jgi:hypothetical protein
MEGAEARVDPKLTTAIGDPMAGNVAPASSL